jgi:lipopolysaccharide export LptBFGC system permease protein LptF
MSYEKFIVCKNFILNENTRQTYNSYIEKLLELKKNYSLNTNQNIKYIIDKDTPYFYINKIDDINNIIGQQQLETIDQVINIYKNKNKDDKIESIKKINIHKSINWCEKMKIPYNKSSEKPNIFLPIINADLDKLDVEENEIIEEVDHEVEEVEENLFIVIENEL